MASENFEDGTAGALLSSSNTIFGDFFGGPVFTSSPVHGGSLAMGAGSGLIFLPGQSQVSAYQDFGQTTGNADVWAICSGSGIGDPYGIISELMGPTSNSFDNSWSFGFAFNPVTDFIDLMYFDEDFVFTQVPALSGAESHGWLKFLTSRIDATSMLARIYDTDGTTLLFEWSGNVFAMMTAHPTWQVRGYTLGASSVTNGALFDVVVDDFNMGQTRRRKPRQRVHPRDDLNRVLPKRSQQGSNRRAGGTYL